MAYFPPIANAQKNYTMTLKDFKGVDFTSSKLNVAINRATDMTNMIYEGINHKRPSWNEVLKDSGNVNGCWNFQDTLGNNHTIAHIGQKIYKITKEDTITDGFDTTSIKTKKVDLTTNLQATTVISDTRSMAIAKDDCLYIFCGTYLVYNGTKSDTTALTEVANGTNTYIPTTTTGITHTKSSTNVRASLESANRLSSKRKNKLLGEAINYTYTQDTKLKPLTANANTDGKIYFNTNIDLTGLTTHDKTNPLLQVTQTLGGSTYTTYILNDSTKIYEYWVVEGGGSWEEEGVTIWNSSEWLLKNSFTFKQLPTGTVNIALQINNEDLFFIKDTIPIQYDYWLDAKADDEDITIDIEYATEEASEVIINNGTAEFTTKIKANALKLKALKTDKIFYEVNEDESLGTEAKGYFTLENAEAGTTQISLYKNYPPLMEGQSNMVVTFTKANAGKLSEINGCTICHMFAIGGFYHLFATGNPSCANYDFYSEYPTDSVGMTYSDFTYFPDEYYERLGDSKDKIMGYSLVGDNTLAIHKQANGNRDTLYLRTGYIDNAKDSLGNIIIYHNVPMKRTYFTTTQGATGEGMISSFANDNLLNDNLFLSSNGVYGLSLSNNIKSNERYALERSGLINGKLIKETSLQNACGISFNGRYYLSVNGHCYVADSRFKNYVAVDLPDTFSYEWWFWDNVNARIFFVINNELYFGTDEGQICKFEKNIVDYMDKTYEKVESLTHSVVEGKSIFTIDPSSANLLAKLKNTDKIRIKGIQGSSEVNLCYTDTDGTTPELAFDCEIINYDEVNRTFQLLWYKDLDNTIHTYNILIDEGIHNYDGFNAYFTYCDNVDCYYATPILDLGTPMYSKQITSLCVTPEKISGGQISIGILTKDFGNLPIDIDGVDIFDFAGIDFSNFTFDTNNFYTSFTKRLNKKCNYMGLYIKSINRRDCAINNILINYRQTELNKGVR